MMNRHFLTLLSFLFTTAIAAAQGTVTIDSVVWLENPQPRFIP